MVFNWSDIHIQRNIVYFEFSYNNENWLFTTLNNNAILTNITSSWHKTYNLLLNEDTDLYSIDAPMFSCIVSITNREINIESKDNA